LAQSVVFKNAMKTLIDPVHSTSNTQQMSVTSARETERQRETERGRERQREVERDRERERERERKRERELHHPPYLGPVQSQPFGGAGVVAAGLGEGGLRGAACHVVVHLVLRGRDLPLAEHLAGAQTPVAAAAALGPLVTPPAVCRPPRSGRANRIKEGSVMESWSQ